MSTLRIGRRRDMDMTQGKIMSQLVSFALPLLLGSIFQQLYNTVDTWVVGNFVGKNSFSAVGTLSSVTNLVISFFMGFSSGASVIISHYFGAKDNENVNRTTHTFVAVTLIMCVVLTLLGIALIPLVLRIMKSPVEVASEQRIYLTIYFAGLSGLLIYNMGSAILRAIGDSTHPFMFLVVSASLNIVLDLVFVIVFHMGTAGVAYATIISQMVSAILVMFVLFRSPTSVRVSLKKLHIYGYILKKIFRVGLPSALQMSITCFSNIFVQSYINQFGSACMAGYGVYGKIDAFALIPVQSISMSSTTFVGQNWGARQPARAREGVRTAIWMSLASTATLGLLVFALARPLMGFFSPVPEVIDYGVRFIRIVTPFYVTICFNQIYAGALRGVGDATAPTVIMLATFVVSRQIYLAVTHALGAGFVAVALAYPVGWILCSTLLILRYSRSPLASGARR